MMLAYRLVRLIEAQFPLYADSLLDGSGSDICATTKKYLRSELQSGFMKSIATSATGCWRKTDLTSRSAM